MEIVADLNADDRYGEGHGIGAGVLGVKIDDVNADGQPEIWCGDAAGHIYLFHWAGGKWRCFYRTRQLGAYPGWYNNIFPIKAEFPGPVTTKLVVASPGYVMAFDVKYWVLP
jgi:hypothetical protein